MFSSKIGRSENPGRPVIDFHSHILPEMDDGSKNVEMSLAMLRESRRQGVDIILATPHFYGFRERPSEFLKRRTRAVKQLSGVLGQDVPALLTGAEVAFYSGLITLDGLSSLCVDGTDILLLEMPFSPWTGLELNVVSALCLDRKYRVVLVHLERFLPLQKDRHLVEQLLDLPLFVQVNAGELCSLRGRRQALGLFRSGRAQLLGSDCHNLDRRPPNLGLARTLLSRKLGQQCLEEIDACGRSLLGLDGGGSAHET